ncbi:MAG: MJ0042-type zinc finger domain-containing protein [Candidatus Thorarchaeota archaeon]
MSLSNERFSLRCPNCNATYTYNTSDLNPEGQVSCQNCGRLIRAEGQTVTVAQEKAPEESYVPDEQRTEGTMMTVVKLYAHGFVFSLLTFFIAVIFGLINVIFAVAGGLIGLVIAFIVLTAMLGGVNIGLASAIWGLNLKSDAQSVIAQGGVIFILMFVLSLLLLPLMIFAYSLLVILDIGIFTFFYGYVFRAIALQFQIVRDDTVGEI